jgi:hypothetical protein
MQETLAVLAVLIGLAIPASAQTYIGLGHVSCDSWTQERRAESSIAQAYTSWVLGYVSGINSTDVLERRTGDFLQNMSGDGLLASIDQYCAAQPKQTVRNAAAQLIGMLRSNTH